MDTGEVSADGMNAAPGNERVPRVSRYPPGTFRQYPHVPKEILVEV